MNKVKTHLTTNIPAPLIPGFYSLQAVSASENVPDVTCFMRELEALIPFRKRLVASGKFCGFLLRHGATKWDVLDAAGKCTHASVDCAADLRQELAEERPLTPRALMLTEAADVLGTGLTRLACAEYHADASAADHSNLMVLMRVMLTDTPTANAHLFLSDTNRKGLGRVTSLVGHMSQMRTEDSDKFLDRHNWTDQGWPLNNAHHADILATRLSSLRASYLADVVCHAAVYDGMPAEELPMVRYNVTSLSTEKRSTLAKDLTEILYSGLEYDDSGKAEIFNTEEVRASAERVMASYSAVYGIAQPA